MVKVDSVKQLEKYLLENGRRAYVKDKESTEIQMELNLKACLRRTKSMDTGLKNIVMDHCVSMENSKIICETGMVF